MRNNPFCVISKETFGPYNVHRIQASRSWTDNPYGSGYAVVPDHMVPLILDTGGFCNLTYNDPETEVVSFEALERPDIPKPDIPGNDNDVWEELDAAYQEGVDSV